jgi:hypothetical protein
VFNLFLQRSLGDYLLRLDRRFPEPPRQPRPSGRRGAVARSERRCRRFPEQDLHVRLQDDIDIADNFQLSIGARFDLFDTQRAGEQSELPNRYGFSNRQTFAGLSIFQPRIGFDWRRSIASTSAAASACSAAVRRKCSCRTASRTPAR